MTEISMNTPQQGLTMLDDLAQEAQFYAQRAVTSLFQLGRVFTEAKKLVRHGEWASWVQENAGCSERTAQQFMQAYARFGENAAAARIADRSKLFKMLSLPAGTEEAFLEEHDVAAMSSREVDAAVRRVREEMQGELDREREARKAAEKLADEAAEEAARRSEPVEVIPPEVTRKISEQAETLAAQRNEIDRLAAMGRDNLSVIGDLRSRNAALGRELQERDEMLEEAQQEHDRLRNDLLNLQSAAVKGDAERIPVDELTLDVFAAAVRQFIGTCARLPYMQHTFVGMSMQERNGYDDLLRTVEGWAKESRHALNTYECEEV